jgi:hypothetical protein
LQKNGPNFTDTIAEENNATDENMLPKFINEKCFNPTFPPRKNRFYEDMEYEVRIKIKEM